MSKNDWICASIEEDEIEIDNNNEIEIVIKKKYKKIKKNEEIKENNNTKEKPKRKKTEPVILKKYYNDLTDIEIGVDEAGRGPLFGRVYSAAVVLPKDDSFDHSLVKDSKKFHSKKKICEVYDYIKKNAIAWAIEYEDEIIIDNINILQATQSAMHKAITNVKKQLHKDTSEILLLIDGNYFKPLTMLNHKTNKLEITNFVTIEGGDNKYSSIAAASILAKVERDNYIDELCKENPELATNYGIDSNKGYGAKKHIEGIKEHGITIWLRRSFGICKDYA
jgi:ribonuclease HII